MTRHICIVALIALGCSASGESGGKPLWDFPTTEDQGGEPSTPTAGASGAGGVHSMGTPQGGSGGSTAGSAGAKSNGTPQGGSTSTTGGSGGHGGVGGHGGAAGGGNGGTGGTSVVGGVGGTGGVGGMAGTGGTGGSGVHEPALPGSDGLIYGYGGGANYLAGMTIECQKANPNAPWKYGEPNFEVRSPVDDKIMASKVPCGGTAWDLNITLQYNVLGYEGDTLWVSTGFNPGHTVIIVMP